MAEITSIDFICNRVIPLVYDDSLSYYEMLGKVIVKLNDIVSNNNTYGAELQSHGTSIGQLQVDVSTMESELEKVKGGNYVSLYLDSIISYIDNNLEKIVSRISKFITFGLSDDGYFIANIPDNWSDISFETEMNVNSSDYGKLILIY